MSHKTKDLYLGLLPVRGLNGILMPNVSWEGWYFSEELKFANENGYSITVIKGYEFDKKYDVFKNFVEHFYNIKSTTNNKTEKAIAKSLLNNLFGRFGLDIYKSKTYIVSEDKYNEIVQTKDIVGWNKLVEDKILINDKTRVSKDMCEKFNVDYKKAILNNLNNKEEKENTFNDVSIGIASAVTSYAGIHMNKIKLDLFNKGVVIYYSDTDSLVTDKPLDNDLVGTSLGLFKL